MLGKERQSRSQQSAGLAHPGVCRRTYAPPQQPDPGDGTCRRPVLSVTPLAFSNLRARVVCRQVNFILFISIIRILVQKLRCTDVGGNEQSQYK